jgi:hypothetical protein
VAIALDVGTRVTPTNVGAPIDAAVPRRAASGVGAHERAHDRLLEAIASRSAGEGRWR